MSRTAPALSHRQAIGSWRLHPGHAMGLQPRRDAVLRIYCGRVWVTQGGPYAVVGRESGDHFLSPGDTLRVPAGAHLVMEPLAEAGDERPVHFDWTEAVRNAPTRFHQQVAVPTRDLSLALGQTGRAFVRLLAGLLGYAEGLFAGSR